MGEYGTYLTFHFGTPKVEVLESLAVLNHRRLARVDGQYVLSVEAYQWVAFQDGGKIAHSESDREVIKRAASTLCGQKLIGAAWRTTPVGGEFHFDLGGRIVFQRKGASETENLWTFSTRLDPHPDDVDILSFTAFAKVGLYTRRGTTPSNTEYDCEGGSITLGDMLGREA